jgi:hypothetical protein
MEKSWKLMWREISLHIILTRQWVLSCIREKREKSCKRGKNEKRKDVYFLSDAVWIGLREAKRDRSLHYLSLSSFVEKLKLSSSENRLTESQTRFSFKAATGTKLRFVVEGKKTLSS